MIETAQRKSQPLVPVAAAFAGLACDFGLRQLGRHAALKLLIVPACCIFFLALGYLSYAYVQPLYTPWTMPALHAGREVDRVVPASALVISATDRDPTMLYYSRRKGWHFPEMGGEQIGLSGNGSALFPPRPIDSREAINDIEKLRRQGGSYLIFTNYTFYFLEGKYSELQKHLDTLCRLIITNKQYIIFYFTVTNRSLSATRDGLMLCNSQLIRGCQDPFPRRL
jgi:hypothetical protein